MKDSVKNYLFYILDDVMRDIEGISSKNMFGGFGLYYHGRIFAFITDESELYFKVDDTLKIKFEKYGSKPFVYIGFKKKKPITMRYWLLPEEILEDTAELLIWIKASASVK